jgi:hydrogenase maturation protease
MTLVLGLGNLLCSDDGLGIAAVEDLVRTYRLPPGVRALDGGTLGLSLLHCFEDGDDAMLIDAVAADRPPGTLVRLDGAQVAPAVRDRLSPHQVGVADLLDALRLLGRLPRRLILLGLVPESLAFGVGLSRVVARRIPDLVAAVVDELRAGGHVVAAPEVNLRSRAVEA